MATFNPDNYESKSSQSNEQLVVNKPKKFAYYNLIFGTAALLPLLLVGLFNYSIDPYGVFNTKQYNRINQAKPEQLKNTRFFKAVDVTRIKPITVFLGSSRTEYGLEPTVSSLNNNQPTYNLAFGAATTYELLRYLEHTIYNQPKLELVILGLDEFMFNELHQESSGFSEKRLEKKHLTIKDAIDSTLSLQALAASYETIKFNQKNPEVKTYTPQGRLYPRLIDMDNNATQYRFAQSLGVYFNSFPQYKLSKKSLDNLQKIVDLCKKHNIDLKIFISPVHATRLETIYGAGHWEMYEEMKREIVKIAPVWDFSGYHEITTEQIDNNMRNYIDDSHYRKEIGDLVINRILSTSNETVPKDFGILVDRDNIETHLQQIRLDRQVWQKEHPEEVNLVEKIKARTIN